MKYKLSTTVRAPKCIQVSGLASALLGRVTLLFPRGTNPKRMALKLPFQGLDWEMLGSQCPYDRLDKGAGILL